MNTHIIRNWTEEVSTKTFYKGKEIDRKDVETRFYYANKHMVKQDKHVSVNTDADTILYTKKGASVPKVWRFEEQTTVISHEGAVVTRNYSKTDLATLEAIKAGRMTVVPNTKS